MGRKIRRAHSPSPNHRLIMSEKLAVVMSELKSLEPIFHHPEPGSSRANYENIISEDFWEVGASGRCYDRKFVLDVLEERRQSLDSSSWQTSEFRCRELIGWFGLLFDSLINN